MSMLSLAGETLLRFGLTKEWWRPATWDEEWWQLSEFMFNSRS